MTIWHIIAIALCVIEAGMIGFMAISLMEAFDVYEDFKESIVKTLEELAKMLEK